MAPVKEAAQARAAAAEPDAAPHFPAIVVGSGFGGLCAAYRLRQEGYGDFIVLERSGRLGGTWRDNDYPGCACDVPAVLYSLSFAQNADWSRIYPTQAELQRYLENVADEFGLRSCIRFNTEMLSAAWDDAAQLWRLETTRGAFSTPILISACGPLSEPAYPAIPGVETFRGRMFHSARWDHSFEVAGKRIAAIGTGASAIQFVPAIAPAAAHLDVYQRTPPWVLPRNDRPTRGWIKALRRTPLKWLFRVVQYWRNESSVLGFVKFPRLFQFAERFARKAIAMQVHDPELLKKVMPDYRMGCKRILTSDEWYPTLQRENVSLVTEEILEVTPSGVRTADGVERPADAIIFGTGFLATDNPLTVRIRGRGGVLLADLWREGEEAFNGTVIHKFPNLFLIAGPNTGIGHTSFVFMIESQMGYVVRCLRLMRKNRLATLEVRKEVQDRFNAELQSRMKQTVWTSGCKSWYLHKSGKNTTIWPGWTFAFYWRLRTARLEDFHYAPDGPREEAGQAPARQEALV